MNALIRLVIVAIALVASTSSCTPLPKNNFVVCNSIDCHVQLRHDSDRACRSRHSDASWRLTNDANRGAWVQLAFISRTNSPLHPLPETKYQRPYYVPGQGSEFIDCEIKDVVGDLEGREIIEVTKVRACWDGDPCADELAKTTTPLSPVVVDSCQKVCTEGPSNVCLRPERNSAALTMALPALRDTFRFLAAAVPSSKKDTTDWAKASVTACYRPEMSIIGNAVSWPGSTCTYPLALEVPNFYSYMTAVLVLPGGIDGVLTKQPQGFLLKIDSTARPAINYVPDNTSNPYEPDTLDSIEGGTLRGGERRLWLRSARDVCAEINLGE